MYSLAAPYYEKEFETIEALVADVLKTGMDPNYEITYRGIGIGHELTEYIQP